MLKQCKLSFPMFNAKELNLNLKFLLTEENKIVNVQQN